MNRLSLAAFAGAVFLAGTAAMAQPPAPPPGPDGAPGHHGRGGPSSAPGRFFEEMDLNKDGVVTRAEVTKVMEERFAALDTDKNGIISPAERAAKWQAMRQRREDERFAAADTNKDGQLSKAEFEAAHGRLGRDGGMHGGPGGDQGPMGGPEHGMGGRPGHEMGGGDITREQFMRRSMTMFNVLDTNQDGKITMAERDAAIEDMRHDGPPRF